MRVTTGINLFLCACVAAATCRVLRRRSRRWSRRAAGWLCEYYGRFRDRRRGALGRRRSRVAEEVGVESGHAAAGARGRLRHSCFCCVVVVVLGEVRVV